ncbi:diacylglycerol kinase [Roseimaritima sediminicola]|uniref:diacylglycerol kinase n=1 Tax=Roseimaritima sediminicola TaxID=2662066 RepID=UPI0012985693|nr:diacylglycerol kinase [Roseimaritima sediminicola]
MGHWIAKFRYAAGGLRHGLATHSSFAVHIPVAVLVLAVAAWLKLTSWRWAVLVLCIALVVCLELVNTAIERLVQAVHPERDERIGHALDLAAAAVLVAALAAVLVGLIVLLPPLWDRLAD